MKSLVPMGNFLASQPAEKGRKKAKIGRKGRKTSRKGEPLGAEETGSQIDTGDD